MNDSSDVDVEIGPQKSAEELLRERERLAEARGDVIDVGADDADAAMPPVAVKPGPAPAVAAAARCRGQDPRDEKAWLNRRVRIQVRLIVGPPEYGTVLGHVVGVDGETYEIEIEHGEDFHLANSNVKSGDTVVCTREDITLWDPRG